MKITAAKLSKEELAARRAQLIQDRDEYETQKAALDAEEQEADERFYEADDRVSAEIENLVRSNLGNYVEELGLDIYVTSSDVVVKCEQNDSPLRWTWTTNRPSKMKPEPKSSTGSWSGLDAVGADKIEKLKQSVDCLAILNNIDWGEVVNKERPRYSDYYKDIFDRRRELNSKKRNFKSEIFDIDVEGAVGEPVIFTGEYGSGKYYRGQVYYRVDKINPSSYEVGEISRYYMDKAKEAGEPFAQFVLSSGATRRVRKSDFADMSSSTTPITDYPATEAK